MERWLSGERFDVYLAATTSRREALDLYEWNAEASAAAFRDLSSIEIAIRNAYNHAIEGAWTGQDHWTDHPATMFPPVYRTRGRGVRVDINGKSREILVAARSKVGASAPPGKVVAELSFGFWRYLSTRGHEKTMWLPYLRHAFPAGTDRGRDVDQPIQALHHLRNRVAHHEPLFSLNLANHHQYLCELATLIDPPLGLYVAERSTLLGIATTRPPVIPPPHAHATS